MRAPGFTLVEMLLALAITSMVIGGATLSIYSVLIPTARYNSEVTALTNIATAGLLIKNDLLMAQSTTLSNGIPSSSVNLTWFDFTSSFGTSFMTGHHSGYSLVNGLLLRNYDGVTSIAGRDVTSIQFTQSTGIDSGKKSVKVVISSGNTSVYPATETLTFTVHLRTEDIK